MNPATDKVDAILSAAMQEFVARGYAATSLDRIASVAGVSKATIHSYYQYKEVLFEALVDHMVCQIDMTSLLTGHKNLPDLLEAIASNILAEDKDEQTPHLRDFIRLIIGESGRFPELAKIFVRKICVPMIESLQLGFTETGEHEPEVSAYQFLGAVIFFDLLQNTLHGKEVIPMDSSYFINCLVKANVAKSNS
jgi:AcrR family transcriptional regulator